MIKTGIITVETKIPRCDFWNEKKYHIEKKYGSCFSLFNNNTEYLISTSSLIKNVIDTITFLEQEDGFQIVETQLLKNFDEIDLSIIKISDDNYQPYTIIPKIK